MKKINIFQVFVFIFMVSCNGNHNSSNIDIAKTSKGDTLLTNIVNKEIVNKEIVKYKFVKPTKIDGHEIFYDNYSVIDLENGEPCSIKFDNKVYKTDNAILDYGELQLLLYENDKDNVAFIGLIDYYGSVFFVYYISNGRLYKLGVIDSNQPKVEDEGFKETTFDVYKEDNVIKIVVYLGKEQTQTKYFKIGADISI
jgi:hypothetical protein